MFFKLSSFNHLSQNSKADVLRLLCHCLVGSNLKLWLGKNLQSLKNYGVIGTQDGGREGKVRKGRKQGCQESRFTITEG